MKSCGARHLPWSIILDISEGYRKVAQFAIESRSIDDAFDEGFPHVRVRTLCGVNSGLNYEASNQASMAHASRERGLGSLSLSRVCVPEWITGDAQIS